MVQFNYIQFLQASICCSLFFNIQLIFILYLFLYIVMYANEYETKKTHS